jgi:hypothetical protein
MGMLALGMFLLCKTDDGFFPISFAQSFVILIRKVLQPSYTSSDLGGIYYIVIFHLIKSWASSRGQQYETYETLNYTTFPLSLQYLFDYSLVSLLHPMTKKCWSLLVLLQGATDRSLQLLQGATGSATPYLALVLVDEFEPYIFRGSTSRIFSYWEWRSYPNYPLILSLLSYK